jgi:SAM-dependent methyltransferase
MAIRVKRAGRREYLESLAKVLAERHGWAYWIALRRALEIEQAQSVRDLCCRPVLDLGCGDGVVASRVFGRADVGVDTGRETLTAARSRYRHAIRADGRRLPFRDASFRTVYSNGSLAQMDELPLVLTEVSRVLADGGVFLFQVPSSDFSQPFFALARLLGQALWADYNDLQHLVNLLDPARWQGLLQRHGLEIRHAGAYGSRALARSIVLRDLLGSLDLSPGWPPVRVRRPGRLDAVAGWLPRPAAPDQDERRAPWLLIAAERVAG